MRLAPRPSFLFPDRQFLGGRASVRWWVLALWLLAGATALHAQNDTNGDPGGANGTTGGFVDFGGGYDAFNGNVKRTITDLVVPGSSGTIPLAFTRTFNSRYTDPPINNVEGQFADSNWRHSYQWEMSATTNSNNVTVYKIAYPDGTVTNFRSNRPNAPAGETYARGPVGTSDRLEVATRSVAGVSCPYHLHLGDGSQVHFDAQCLARTLEDPYGAPTKLTYGTYQTDPTAYSPSYAKQVLSSVTEPGGRSLSFHYATLWWRNNTTGAFYLKTVMDRVSFSDAGGTERLWTAYAYTRYSPTGIAYFALTTATYCQGKVSGGNLQATYTYTTPMGLPPDSISTPPLLTTCADPYYAGAMTRIRYVYASTTDYGIWGVVKEEWNPAYNGAPVSRLGQDVVGAPTYATAARGDTVNPQNDGAIYLNFWYGQASTAAGTTNAKPFQATTTTDFGGHPSYPCYNPAGDDGGQGYVASVTDAKGVKTAFATEPFTGKVKKTTLADGSNTKTTWGGRDTNPAAAYYALDTTDRRGNVTYQDRYTNTGLVYRVRYPDGGAEYFNYQAFYGNGGAFYKVGVAQNQRGGQVTNGYDETDFVHGGSGYQGLLTSVTRSYAVGSQVVSERTKFYYDALDRLIKSVDPRGVTTQYEYNLRHQVTRTYLADLPATVYGYDDYGNRTSVTDPNGKTTVTTYDDYRRVYYTLTPVNSPDAAGTNIASRYQAFDYTRRNTSNQVIGDALSHTSSAPGVMWTPSGNAVQRIYRPEGWLSDEYQGMSVNGSSPAVPTTTAASTHTHTDYNVLGQVMGTVDAQGATTTFTYDSLNRPWKTADPLNHTTTRTYYDIGENALDDPANKCVGLPKSVEAPGPNLYEGTMPNVTTWFRNYDAMGRLTSTLDPKSQSFRSQYDLAGALAQQSDGAQPAATPGSPPKHWTGYGYDQLGRKTTLTHPDGTQEKWTYDASGNVLTYKNRAGAVCTYSFGGRNRLDSYSWSGNAASPVVYEYDLVGRTKRVLNQSADVRFNYDDAGTLTSEVEQIVNVAAMTTSYRHNADGQVDAITYPNGNYPCFSYDALGRGRGMYSGGTTFSANTFGGDRLTARALRNGLTTTYGYQNDGRVNETWHQRSDGSRNVDRRFYGHAPNGQISWWDRESDYGQGAFSSGSTLERGRGDAYAYWPDGSLREAWRDYACPGGWPQPGSPTADGALNLSNNGGGLSPAAQTPGEMPDPYRSWYIYDAAGNRAQVQQFNQTAFGYSENSLGQNQYNGSGYDANGNTTNSAVGWTYAYNAENQMTGASGPSGQSLAFTYDGLGRVVTQIANGVGTLFYYAGAQRIEERDYSNNALRYLYFFDAPGSDQILFRQGGPWGRLWYQYDALGHTTHLSDDAGAVVEAYLYDAYGTPSFYTGTGAPLAGGSQYDNRYLFCGSGAYEWLSQAGLYYCRARMYLPAHGRFLQPDPIGQAGGLNLYAYCGNDPVNNRDPEGKSAFFQRAGVQSTGYTPTGSHIPSVWYTSANGGVYLSNAVLGPTYFGKINYIDSGNQTSNAHAGAILKGGEKGTIALFWGAGGQANNPRFSNYAITEMKKTANADGYNATSYGRDEQNRAVASLIDAANMGSSISIIGYSRGAVAAIDVAQTLNAHKIAVKNLITIDPVSYWGNGYSVPSNVERAYNFYETNGSKAYGALHLNGYFGGQRVNGAQNWDLSVGGGVNAGSHIMEPQSHVSIPFAVEDAIRRILLGE